MVSIAIGITGLIGSGKDTVANYIGKKYGFFVLSMGDITRDIVRELGLPMNRESQQYVGVNYKQEINDRMMKILKSHKRSVIIGIRKYIDYENPKRLLGKRFYLIFVKAGQKTRFERLKKRSSERDAKTFGEFLKQDRKEKEIFEFDRIFPKVDFVIENNGTVEELERKIDRLMAKILTAI